MKVYDNISLNYS